MERRGMIAHERDMAIVDGNTKSGFDVLERYSK